MATQLIEFRPNIQTVQRRFQDRVAELQDLRRPNREIAVVLDRWVQQNFRTQGALVGGWTPFKYGGRIMRNPQSVRIESGDIFSGLGGGIDALVTIRRKRRKKKKIDRSAKLLQDTGALRLSFRPFWDSRKVGIGSDLEYSKYHNEGSRFTSIGGGIFGGLGGGIDALLKTRLPQRRMLPKENDVIKPIMNVYQLYIDRLTRKAL